MNRVFDGIRDSFGETPTAGIFHSISGVTSVWHAYEFGFRWDALVLFDPPLVTSPGHRYHEVARDFELTLSGWSKDRPERFASPDDLAAQFRSSKSLARWIEGSHELMARSILREDKGSRRRSRTLVALLPAGRRKPGLRHELRARSLPASRRPERTVQDYRQRPRRPARPRTGPRQPRTARGIRAPIRGRARYHAHATAGSARRSRADCSGVSG